MKCPACDEKLESKTGSITDTRPMGENRNGFRRRRHCLKCGYAFTTIEIPILDPIRQLERIMLRKLSI